MFTTVVNNTTRQTIFCVRFLRYATWWRHPLVFVCYPWSQNV